MSNKVLFLNGPSQDSCDRFFGWPTSLLYAVAPTYQAAKSGALNVEIVEPIFDPIWFTDENEEALVGEFCDLLPGVDVVCASATYDSFFPVCTFLRASRKVNPEIVWILGGPHVDEILRLKGTPPYLELINCGVDFLVSGDGEYALVELLRYLNGESGKILQGEGKYQIYDCERDSYHCSNTPLDLSTLPKPYLDLVDVERHQFDFDVFRHDCTRPAKTVQMIASRGCAYNCSFCSERNELAEVQNRSIDSILEQIYQRKSEGYEAIFFDDSTFGANPFLRELLGELEKSGMRFGSLNRFNHLTNPKLIDAYKRAGFEYFYCAIEQYHDETLSLINKSQRVSTINSSLKLLKENDLSLGVSLLYGVGGESRVSIEKTLRETAHWVDEGLIVLVSESVLSDHKGLSRKGEGPVFLRKPPNRGYPFDRFEEGQWYHEPHVTKDWLDRVFTKSSELFSEQLVRNRHSWYMKNSLLNDHVFSSKSSWSLASAKSG